MDADPYGLFGAALQSAPSHFAMGDALATPGYRADRARSLGASAPTAIDIGLVVPMQGPAGMFGLSCLGCAVLAADELNSEGGLLGRAVRLLPIDGGGAPEAVADRVESLVRAGAVDGIVGWHLSHVRRAIATRLDGAVPYVYSALYEGGERAPGVFLTGETPDRQIAPAMAWLFGEAGVRRWAVVGDDYLWPRGCMPSVRACARSLGLEIVDERFVPLGQEDYSEVLRCLRRSGAEAVLLLLVGQDAVAFNRAFAAAELDASMLRLSPLMDENMLLGSGPDATRDLYSAAAYFASLPTSDALELMGRYVARFGADAPVLNSMGESCYEGVRLLAALVRSAGSLRVPEILWAGESPVGYHGPRGAVHLQDRHLVQDVYLARADGTAFDVLARV